MDLQTDKIFSKILSSYFVIYTLNTSVAFLSNNETIQRYRIYFCAIIFIFIFIKNTRYIPKFLLTLGFLEIAFGFLLLWGKLINPVPFSLIFNRVVWTIVFGLPLFLSAKFTTNHNSEELLNGLSVPSNFILVTGIIVLFFNYIIGKDHSYNMTLGYSLLIPAMFYYQSIFKKRSSIIFFFVSCLVIILCGSRGPLLPLSIFMLYRLIYALFNVKSKRELFLGILFICAIIISLIFFDSVLQGLKTISSFLGINSRTINLIFSGNMTSDSGRSHLYDLAWRKIKEKPLLGWGLAGELAFLNGYPHHFFTEICVDFGLPIGIIICTCFVYKLAKRLFRDKFHDVFFVLLICGGFIPLFLSGSYLSSPLFWVVLGYLNSKEQKMYR